MKAMSLPDKLVACLPFAFAIHNIEEAWAIYHQELNRMVNPVQFSIAVSLFTILGFILVFGRKRYPDPRAYQSVITGFAGMLFLNSFFPHIVATLYFGTYMPGVVSAFFLLLPLTTGILYKIFRARIFLVKQFIITILAGGIAGIVLVFLFLGVGYVIGHLICR